MGNGPLVPSPQRPCPLPLSLAFVPPWATGGGAAAAAAGATDASAGRRWHGERPTTTLNPSCVLEDGLPRIGKTIHMGGGGCCHRRRPPMMVPTNASGEPAIFGSPLASAVQRNRRCRSNKSFRSVAMQSSNTEDGGSMADDDDDGDDDGESDSDDIVFDEQVAAALEEALLLDGDVGGEFFGVEDDDDDGDESDGAFLQRELTRLESLEGLLQDIEKYCLIEDMCDDDEDDDDDDGEGDDVDELFSLLQQTESTTTTKDSDGKARNIPEMASLRLEQALLQGVVPAYAQVGGDTLPGDWGFDPLHLAEKDYLHQAQYWLLSLVPGGNPDNDPPPGRRPSALVLRDYREAEIRHGRLAMLAAIIWPLQEKLDKLYLEDDQFGPLIYGPVTLPYFPLVMTLLMMLLGYLDIYAKAIKEEEGIGDAFLPGDCFWDPLKVLEGAPPSMKRNMQERELFNGRVAMVAVAAYVFEEATSHQALVDIASNELLFVPAYQVSFIQEWLDGQFGTYYR